VTVDPERIDKFQHIAVEKSRLHIPLLFGYDVIHGFKTIFPFPAGDGVVLGSIGGREGADVLRRGNRAQWESIGRLGRW